MLNGLVALSKDSKESKVFRDWGKQFSIKFEIEITKEFSTPTWLNVFHMTIGGNNHQHGDRIPALFIRNTKKLFFTMSVGDKHNYHWNFPYQLNQNYSKSKNFKDVEDQTFKIYIILKVCNRNFLRNKC